MADSTWPCDGELASTLMSTEKMLVEWDIYSYLKECLGKNEECESIMKVKSENFSFCGATWNFFASFDRIETRSQFGINVRILSSSDEAFYCSCYIFFDCGGSLQNSIENMVECNFILPSAESHWTVTDILTSNKLKEFLDWGQINCLITIKNIKEASSQTESTHSSWCSSVETQTQLPENEDKGIPVGNIDCKVCQDFKNLLLSGEGSDVTLKVQDQEFRAHRSVITARSSVFAAMFRHDMKEKATGVVNVEDCEPSYFPVLLEFLYCGSTEKLSVENVFSLYTSAEKYDVQDLKMKCIEFIQKNLSVETFCDTARLSLQHSENNLLKLTTDFFTRNLKKIILTVKWQTFITENPIQGNEFFIKALVSDVKDD